MMRTSPLFLPAFDPSFSPDTGPYTGGNTSSEGSGKQLLAHILSLLAPPSPPQGEQQEDLAGIVLDSLSLRPAPSSGQDGGKNILYLVLRSTAEQAAILAPQRPYAEKKLRDQPDLAGLLHTALADSSHHAAIQHIIAVHISFTAHHSADSASPHTQTGSQATKRQKGHRPFALGQAHQKNETSEELLPHIRTVIAVSSGKGGVGKSTIAVNLACGLAQLGLAVGLLDADIYGPSLPHMLGVHVRPEVINGKLQPLKIWGLETMSIGYLVDDRQAMIWRGPMVMGALGQFMRDVAWGKLDVLVVDMPPGTGDAQLTLTQKLGDKLAQGGAIIVSTPQDIALLDARRGVGLFEKARVPILGMVENMSWFCCPHCHERTDIFGHGGARQEAASLSLPFLGEIPLLADIRLHADSGTPILLAAPESDAAQAYRALSRIVADKLTV